MFLSKIDYKVNSAQVVTGNTSEITFSDNNGVSFLYPPLGIVDGNVTIVRWRINGQVEPKILNNNGVVKVGVVVK